MVAAIAGGTAICPGSFAKASASPTYAPQMAAVRVPPSADTVPPLWLAGHVAWLAEYWIGRNPQRGLGPRCPADGVRLEWHG